MIPRVVCSAGEKLVLTGYAIDIGHSISGIEFSLDDGAHWTRYDTAGADSDRRVNWTFEFLLPERGFYTMQVRSVNDEGTPSPEADSFELLVE